MNIHLEQSDSELVRVTLEGQQTAFEELVKRYEQPIYRYCKKLLSQNHHDSEEVTSEVFYKAYRNLARFDQQRTFSSWLYRIAHNTAVNVIRSKAKWFSVDMSEFVWVPAEKKDEQPLTSSELHKVLDTLKIDDRNILILFYLEEQSLKEIADILKLTENTVAQKLSRARKKARIILHKTYPNLEL
jgi:RNA polymerase sigma-70 factor, ECF subfamily